MDQLLFTEIVRRFEEATDEEQQSLNMNDLMIQHKGQKFLHSFKRENTLSDIRSISKTVLTMFLGVVMQELNIDEETYIYPIIKEVVTLENKENLPKLEKIQIKHLLTHTIGYDDVLMMRRDITDMAEDDYINYLVNYLIPREPGEHYLYSNAGFYMLGVFLQGLLQEDLLVVIERELFQPLEIINFKWGKYGNYIAGATRLWLLPEDLIKFGELILNDGKYNGKQLITKEWLEKMTRPRIHINKVDHPERTYRRYAYGLGIWLAKEPIYFGHGTDGQALVVVPEKELILTVLAEQPDIEPIEKIINELLEDM